MPSPGLDADLDYFPRAAQPQGAGRVQVADGYLKITGRSTGWLAYDPRNGFGTPHAPQPSGALLDRAKAHVGDMKHELWQAVALTAHTAATG